MPNVVSYSPSNGQNFYNNPRPNAVWTLTANTGNAWESVSPRIMVSKVGYPDTSGVGASHIWIHDWWRIGLGDTHTIAAALASGYPSLSNGTWYGRIVIYSSEEDNWVNNNYFESYNATFTFTVLNQAIVTTVSPTLTPIIPTTTTPVFTWQYSTADPGRDVQTAYEIEVRQGAVGNISGTTVVANSGKQSSGSQTASLTVPSGISSQNLWWRVRVWNSEDYASNWTGLQNFNMVDPPTVSVSSPTNNQVVTTGAPSLTVNPLANEGATITKISTSAWTGGQEVWRKLVTGNYSTGSTVVVSDPNFAFNNNTLYTYQVNVTDSNGMTSATVSRNFTTSFILPATPSGTVAANTNTHDVSGYIGVTWSGSVRDADFLAWQIERRDHMISPTGDIVESSLWNVIGRNYETTSTVEFRDFTAPMNYRSEYRVRQVALRFGVELVSSNGITIEAVQLTNLAYWLVGGINGESTTATAVRLYNVTEDGLVDEDERAEFNLIGRGRYVENGDNLGVRGQLTLKLRDSDGIMARQKRRLLDSFKRTYKTAWLKNPYGDVYSVNIGDMNISRIAGVGSAEFCDVTIPYVEVIS